MTNTIRNYRSRRLQERAELNRTLQEYPEARVPVEPIPRGLDPRFRRRESGFKASQTMTAKQQSSDPASFAVALRRAREERGLSQSRLAMLSGHDHSYVSRLESESRTPTRDAVLKLARAMGCDEKERDGLLAAAGFLPLKIENLLAAEPCIGEAYQLLLDRKLPRDVRDDLRSAISMATRQAQRAVSTWDGEAAGA